MPEFAEGSTRRPDPGGLPRPRLLAPLVADDGPGVVVVIAPPGSGKTTLLTRAVTLSPRPVAWYAVGPEDRQAAAFVARLAAAVAEAVGADLGSPTTAAQFVHALNGMPGLRVLIMLDDVHELEGSPAEPELAELLRLRPADVRVALGTRRPLGSNTPRLMVSGELIELDSEDLRFRSWEVEELFRLVYGEPLSPEGAAALTRRTGGWAAGLMLFHLATRGKSAVDRERAVVELGGRSRLLRSYLTRNVLDELEPERRVFLLSTCTLGTLTGPLCDELLGREGSASVLEDLATHQFFTTLAENGRYYRYHQVLQTHLEGLLVDECGPAAAADLYARSALLLESGGYPREALRAYAMAEDFASMARVLQQTTSGLALDPGVLVHAARDDPWLALVEARHLQRAGMFAEAVAAFENAEALLDDADFRRRCRDERAVARVWLADATIAEQPPASLMSPRAIAQAVRVGTRRIPPPDRLPGHPLADGLLLLFSGDAGQASAELAHVTAGSVTERLFADLCRIAAEIITGDADDPVATLEQIILTAEVEEQPWVARVASGLQRAVLLVTTPERWRVESCASLVDECDRAGDRWGAVLLGFVLGVAQVLRRESEALQWLDRATDAALDLQAPVLAAWAAAVASYEASLGGHPDAPERAQRSAALRRAAGIPAADAIVAAHIVPRQERAEKTEGIVLRCFGPFRIDLDGEPVELPSLRPLPRALLQFLALNHGRDVHREVIVDQLWPAARLETAIHRLHVAASTVRNCLARAGLGTDVMQRHGDAYRLSLDGASVDVEEFESAVRAATGCEARGDDRGALSAFRRALDTYLGELLSEAGPAEWVVAERDRLRIVAADAAYAAGRLCLRFSTPGEALAYARRATLLDPLRDSAWALLADTQERMGDRASAAATMREYELVANLTDRRPTSVGRRDHPVPPRGRRPPDGRRAPA